MRQILLQYVKVFYYKMRQKIVCYKICQDFLSQNHTVLLQNASAQGRKRISERVSF